jgi:hypothetical protein
LKENTIKNETHTLGFIKQSIKRGEN